MNKIYGLFFCTCLTLVQTPFCNAWTGQLQKAVDLYEGGLYASAMTVLQAMPEYGSDAVVDGYAVLCAQKQRTPGYRTMADNYMRRYPAGILTDDVRLERAFDHFDTGEYEAALGDLSLLDPTKYPDPAFIDFSEEPITSAHIYSPNEYVGAIMDLCQERRGVFKDMTYVTTDRVDIAYDLPLNEIIYDFFDVLKSRTKGYASFDYEIKGYERSDLVKLDVLLNGDGIDALSFIIHSEKAYGRARKIAEKLKDNIPRQLFEVPIQAAIGGKIIARETVKAMRKDVLAKCYGGDITRKKKLLEKQKEGKKRMRQFGTVEVPQEAFMAVLKLDE